MAKRSNPMHVPSRDVTRYFLNVKVPASDVETMVVVEVSMCQRRGNQFIDLEPLLGDGLVPPDKIKWAGKEYPLEPLAWKLLDLLVRTFEKRLEERKVLNALWPDRKGGQDALKVLQSRLNSKLREIDFYAEVKRKAGFVLLETN